MDRRARWVVSTTAVAGYAALQIFARTYATTPRERAAAMPGDEIVERPQTVITRAITIPAPPEDVWPWLVQVGWHRGGWYTARWVDVLLFRDNLPSADAVLERYQGLGVGDLVPDGAPGTRCGFDVRELQTAARLVLHSTTHLPLSWRMHDRARISWTWAFVLTPMDGGRATRLLFRWRARTWPWWLTTGAHLFVVPADLVMSHDMLHGLRARVVGATSGTSGSAGTYDDQGPLR